MASGQSNNGQQIETELEEVAAKLDSTHIGFDSNNSGAGDGPPGVLRAGCDNADDVDGAPCEAEASISFLPSISTGCPLEGDDRGPRPSGSSLSGRRKQEHIPVPGHASGSYTSLLKSMGGSPTSGLCEQDGLRNKQVEGYKEKRSQRGSDLNDYVEESRHQQMAYQDALKSEDSPHNHCYKQSPVSQVSEVKRKKDQNSGIKLQGGHEQFSHHGPVEPFNHKKYTGTRGQRQPCQGSLEFVGRPENRGGKSGGRDQRYEQGHGHGNRKGNATPRSAGRQNSSGSESGNRGAKESLRSGESQKIAGNESGNRTPLQGKRDARGNPRSGQDKTGSRRGGTTPGQANREVHSHSKFDGQHSAGSRSGDRAQDQGYRGDWDRGHPGASSHDGGKCEDRTAGQRQKGGHQHTSNRKQSGKKQQFSPYWSVEDVSAGLKRGRLIQGPIRINPKNFGDAYVPLPDGSADVYISGIVNRNRALNGDIVAVELLDQENWRVFTDDLEQYEASVKVKVKAKGEKDSESDGENSGPDVIVEEEIEIVTGSEQSELNKTEEKNNPSFESENRTNKSSENFEKTSHKTDKSAPRNGPSSASSQSAGLKKDNISDKPGTPQKDKTNTPKKSNYTSVQDILAGGSSVACNLFSNSSADYKGGSLETRDQVRKRLLQKTGKVVYIIERKHSRACSGHIKLMQDKNSDFALFSPLDHRLPRIQVPVSDCPKDFHERPEDHAGTLYIARITEWGECFMFPKGHLARSLGEAGQIEPETDALLIENDVDFREFSQEVLACISQQLPWEIPEEDLHQRRDFCKQCVFTIDPATARDLDDALSCEDIGGGMYEIGVHIADVSYFLQEGTPLDGVAASRATSVYLVQKVIPMLPSLLCEELCSLNPDADRLTFSVVWKINDRGEICKEWFGRSVIRSCVKMSYDHAQGFIDQPDREWTVDELPTISNNFTIQDIKKRVLQLNKIAVCLRKERFDNGALRLDQVKLQFCLDQQTGLPNGYFIYQQRDSNRLIEEFMLLANMAVAHKIKKSYTEKALLRRHPPPQSKMVDDLKELCKKLEVPLDVTDSGSLQRSMSNYSGSDEFSVARMQILVALCSKPMQNAKYFCSGMIEDETVYHHYALNVPLYTHFTSPIRRYADVIVHRLLAASLGYCAEPKQNKQEIHKQAEHCNDKKTASKRVQELSSEIFFAVFVKLAGPFEERAMVMGVMDKSFDIYVLKLGVSKRVYCDKLALKSYSFIKDHKQPVLTLVWAADDANQQEVTQTITIFTMVNSVLMADNEPLKWRAVIKRPRKTDKS